MTQVDALTLFVNPRHGVPGVTVLPTAAFQRAWETITGWDGYQPTPLRDLAAIAQNYGVASLHLKDESARFSLGSFKALGGAYAVAQLAAAEQARSGKLPGDLTVTCATDGNHGRSVAWGASRVGCRCVIFVHAGVSEGRVAAIEAFGATVERTPGNYDDSVRHAEAEASRNGWLVVSDTSYPGYTEVPRTVMQGYRVMAEEVTNVWSGAPPTHVFMQAGVGGAAAAISAHLRLRFSPTPLLIIVEPVDAACLLESARAGKSTVVQGELNTIMAGLACGEVSLLAWQELERAAYAFTSIPDQAAVEAMRLLAAGHAEIGESGVAGLAALCLAAADPASRDALRLTGDSRVLLFGTEGVTDAKIYASLLGSQRVNTFSTSCGQ